MGKHVCMYVCTYVHMYTCLAGRMELANQLVLTTIMKGSDMF